jgi:uncharacterized membrane protein
MPFRPPKRKMDHPAQPGSSSLKKSPSTAVPTNQPAVAVQAQIRAQTFSGPLPPPDLLDAYERTMPGLADRIVKMAEKEQSERLLRERSTNTVAGWLQIGGQLGALVLSGVAILTGYNLLMADKSLAGFTFFLSAAAALVGTAMYRHKHTANPKE